MKIETNLNEFDQDDFDDGRIATEVHYDSDSGDISGEVKIDLLGYEKKGARRRPRSATKRERNIRNDTGL